MTAPLLHFDCTELLMTPNAPSEALQSNTTAKAFTAEDVAAILRESGWLGAGAEVRDDSSLQEWLTRAAELLGPYSTNRSGLLKLIFRYEASEILKEYESQAVLARSGAREVIRQLANLILDGGGVDSDRFKAIVEAMKAATPYRSRELFQPIRLALSGSSGAGELDRVILLLDGAAKLNFAVDVKSTRQRMLEFCAALD
jgi:glutamyl/glutaminyl-tRNA synthetase